MASYLAKMGWLDCRGLPGVTTFRTSAADQATARGQANAFAPLLSALSNANWQSRSGVLTSILDSRQLGGTTLYSDIADRVQLYWITNGPTLLRVEVPCPNHTLFLSDSETINNSLSAIVALAAGAVTNHICTFTGHTAQTFIGGRRIRRPMPRRFTAGVLNPRLDGPA